MRITKKFQERWLGLFNEYINIDPTEWPELVEGWMSQVQLGEEDEFSEEQCIQDELVARLQGAERVEDKETAYGNSNTYYQEGDILFYASPHITEIMREIDVKKNHRRLREYLAPLLLGDSKPVRVGRKTRRFWQFKREAILNDLEEEE